MESHLLGGGSIMVWAVISMNTKTPLVNINGNLNARQYQNQIVQPFILLYLAVNRGMGLAQDNAYVTLLEPPDKCSMQIV